MSLYPKSEAWSGIVVIWIDGKGKRGMFLDDGKPIREVASLLNNGAAVISADLFGQGEFRRNVGDFSENRIVGNPREFAGYTYGYNDPMFAQRVHDILTLVSFVQRDEHDTQRIHVVGLNGAAAIVSAACATMRDAVDKMAVDSANFRFAGIESYRHPEFVPGAVKYGDFPTLLALFAPESVWIGGGLVPEIVQQAYMAAGQRAAVQTGTDLEEMAGWLAAE